MIICNARIFTASEDTDIIECGYIETSGGKITAVGSMDEFSGSTDASDTIDASGLTI